MIQGVVNARLEAVVRLRIRGPSGIEHDVDVIVDTGFSASLTLPPALVSALNLNWDSGGKAVLADGSVRRFDVYAAELLWDSNVAAGTRVGRRTRTAPGNAFARRL